MKKIVFILFVLPVLFLASCTKTGGDPITTPLPVTTAIKTGDWMVNTYMENGANKSSDFELTMIKFSPNGTLIANKSGSSFNGTWTETNTAGINTFTINIATPDTKLQKANGAWKVTSVTEFFIDLQNGNSMASSSINLMKH